MVRKIIASEFDNDNKENKYFSQVLDDLKTPLPSKKKKDGIIYLKDQVRLM